jgi:hypothetical protein
VSSKAQTRSLQKSGGYVFWICSWDFNYSRCKKGEKSLQKDDFSPRDVNKKTKKKGQSG